MVRAGQPLGPQIAALGEMVEAKQEEFVQKLGARFSALLVENTPLDTGLLRGSWKAGKGGNIRRDGNTDWRNNLNELIAFWAGWKVGTKAFLVNTAFYSRYVEEGTHKMAPRAMLARTRQSVPRMASEVAREVWSNR